VPAISDLTVVVPTRNEAANIVGFLASLPADVRLIVVDHSDDDTVGLIHRLRAHRTQVLRFTGSLTEARQLGAESALTEWVLFTDADLRFDTGFFDRLTRHSGDVVYGAKLSKVAAHDHPLRFAVHGPDARPVAHARLGLLGATRF
jgi:glycosyltransferase involved in cell wall biosynthesis